MTHHEAAASAPDFRTRLQNWLPKLVLSPSLALIFVFVYGFIAFTVYLSFTGSRMLPSSDSNRTGQPTPERPSHDANAPPSLEIATEPANPSTPSSY